MRHFNSSLTHDLFCCCCHYNIPMQTMQSVTSMHDACLACDVRKTPYTLPVGMSTWRGKGLTMLCMRTRLWGFHPVKKTQYCNTTATSNGCKVKKQSELGRQWVQRALPVVQINRRFSGRVNIAREVDVTQMIMLSSCILRYESIIPACCE